MSLDMRPEITVVICTFNRYDLLPEAIASIELQDFSDDAYELIIVDNSDDLPGQERFLDGLEIACRHQYIKEARPGLSRARNIGTAAAAGPVVAFIDDDAKATPGWLGAIVDAFTRYERAAIAGGPVRPIWTAPRPPWLHPWLEGYLTILDRGSAVRILPQDEWLAGTNIAFRTDVLKTAGLFPENMGRIGRLLLSNEELLVSDNIRQLGWDAVYDPAIVVHHRVHRERANQAWLRRRVFWQTISDLFAERGAAAAQPDHDRDIHRILDFLARLAPKNRGAMGLLLDLDDAQLFQEQTEAIGAFVRLLAGDGGDWRRILATAHR
jgi:glycosyltransferase involved in cell wall biosynthesis